MSRLLTLLLLIASSLFSVTLDGVKVSKDKFVVYIMIGHSNMVGRAQELDVIIHPHAWNYFIKDCCQTARPHHTWIPAQDCIHKDYSGSGSGPCMPFLKKMVAAFPDYYFGVVQNANSGAMCSANYLKGNDAGDLDLYSELMHAIDSIKTDVTFGGIICMLGIDEAVHGTDSLCRRFSADIATMVQQIRDTLNLPDLPFLMGGFERDAPEIKKQGKYWALVDSQITTIPSVISHSAIIPSDSLAYFDRWHYTQPSYEIWTRRAVNIIVNQGWFPHPLYISQPAYTHVQTQQALPEQITACDALGRVPASGIQPAATATLQKRPAWNMLFSNHHPSKKVDK